MVRKNPINDVFEQFLSFNINYSFFYKWKLILKVENKIIKYEYSHSGKELIANIYFEEDIKKINNYLK